MTGSRRCGWGQARLSVCLQSIRLQAGREQVTEGMGGTREPLRVLEQAGVLDLGRFLGLNLNNNNSSN